MRLHKAEKVAIAKSAESPRESSKGKRKERIVNANGQQQEQVMGKCLMISLG